MKKKKRKENSLNFLSPIFFTKGRLTNMDRVLGWHPTYSKARRRRREGGREIGGKEEREKIGWKID